MKKPSPDEQEPEEEEEDEQDHEEPDGDEDGQGEGDDDGDEDGGDAEPDEDTDDEMPAAPPKKPMRKAVSVLKAGVLIDAIAEAVAAENAPLKAKVERLSKAVDSLSDALEGAVEKIEKAVTLQGEGTQEVVKSLFGKMENGAKMTPKTRTAPTGGDGRPIQKAIGEIEIARNGDVTTLSQGEGRQAVQLIRKALNLAQQGHRMSVNPGDVSDATDGVIRPERLELIRSEVEKVEAAGA